MTDECSRCKFFDPKDKASYRDGRCKRHAPHPNTGVEATIALFVVDIHYDMYRELNGETEGTSNYSAGGHNGEIYWPLVYSDDWCGEFIEKPPAPGANEEDGK